VAVNDCADITYQQDRAKLSSCPQLLEGSLVSASHHMLSPADALARRPACALVHLFAAVHPCATVSAPHICWIRPYSPVSLLPGANLTRCSTSAPHTAGHST